MHLETRSDRFLLPRMSSMYAQPYAHQMIPSINPVSFFTSTFQSVLIAGSGEGPTGP